MGTRFLLFLCGGLGGLWAIIEWVFNPFEKLICYLYWRSLWRLEGSDGFSLNRILESSTLQKAALAFCIAGIVLAWSIPRIYRYARLKKYLKRKKRKG